MESVLPAPTGPRGDLFQLGRAPLPGSSYQAHAPPRRAWARGGSAKSGSESGPARVARDVRRDGGRPQPRRRSRRRGRCRARTTPKATSSGLLRARSYSGIETRLPWWMTCSRPCSLVFDTVAVWNSVGAPRAAWAASRACGDASCEWSTSSAWSRDISPAEAATSRGAGGHRRGRTTRAPRTREGRWRASWLARTVAPQWRRSMSSEGIVSNALDGTCAVSVTERRKPPRRTAPR